MNIEYIEIENIKIAKPLYDLVEQEIIPNTGINTNHFWTSFGSNFALFYLTCKLFCLITPYSALFGPYFALLWYVNGT